MKKTVLIVGLNLLFVLLSFSQSKVYTTSGGEMIFSFATIDNEGDESGNIMRWSPVFNFQGMLNADLSDHVGLFTGLAIRNVGYIYDNYKMLNDVGDEINVKKKFRTYNLGLPVGIKIGNMKKSFIYGGYEIEFPFHYKEKTFIDEKKDKLTSWFSNRVEQFQHGFLVGIQLPYGANIKFKYYLSSFHNTDYVESSTSSKPYENLNVNVFYFSLNFNLFKDTDFYHSQDKSKEYF
jgi:hypothetical protein